MDRGQPARMNPNPNPERGGPRRRGLCLQGPTEDANALRRHPPHHPEILIWGF